MLDCSCLVAAGPTSRTIEKEACQIGGLRVSFVCIPIVRKGCTGAPLPEVLVVDVWMASWQVQSSHFEFLFDT